MPKGKFGRGYLSGVTREQLHAMYHDEKLSMHQMAERLNVTYGAIYYQMRKHGVSTRSHDDALITLGKSGRYTGERNPRWTGGRHISTQGYVLVRMPDHPKACNRGYVREHVLVWERHHKTSLPKGWHVHHKNGVKTDNRPENLEAMTHQKHSDVIPALLRRIAELETKLQESQDELCNLRDYHDRIF